MNTATERSERSRASARFEMPRRYAAHHLLRRYQLPQLLGGRIFHIKEGWMAEQRSGAMENRKIKVKSLISVTAWAVALGMFIAYLFLKRQWMLFTIDFAILLCCLLGISDPEEDKRSKNVYWILLITRVMDITIRCV